jgi:hypothetical protein
MKQAARLSGSGVANFDALHSRVNDNAANALAFDLLMLNGDDLRRKRLKGSTANSLKLRDLMAALKATCSINLRTRTWRDRDPNPGGAIIFADLIGKLDADGAVRSSISRPQIKIPAVRPLARRQVFQVLTWAAPFR